MSKKVFLNNCNCNFNPCCCDKVTPTTTCIPLPSPPCIQVCDEYVDPACIIYSGDDVECYGIKKGDTIAQIFSLIFEKLDLLNCSCDYGSSVIQNITTTTSTTTSTSTTTTSTTTICTSTSTTTQTGIKLFLPKLYTK